MSPGMWCLAVATLFHFSVQLHDSRHYLEQFSYCQAPASQAKSGFS